MTNETDNRTDYRVIAIFCISLLALLVVCMLAGAVAGFVLGH